ncbi:follistatin isoform X2 [Schistocerca cancellata]|uniref:follistatin isoform X2 n=1 Tax=Schistocerca cancellata TaxID=274614 RepID=UPI0021195260|nr:follistatin isoform X2 [Schistocerca cancellata]
MCTHHHGPRGQSSPDTGRSRTPPPQSQPQPLLPAVAMLPTPAVPPMLPILLSLLVLTMLMPGARGGNCWSLRVRNGRCTDLLSQKVSKEECCTSSSVATAWSEEDLDAGTLFFWRVLGGGVPCTACKESCAGVQCGEGRRCVLRRGAPRCVCAADCKARARLRGPVCGTDGRSYTSVCRLRRRACRRKVPALAVDYPGKCQSSCERVQCGAGRHCLLDQNLRPHCVRCAQRCPSAAAAAASAQPASRQVCGADGVTYPSACHLREAACLKGRAIPEAYKGRCKQGASCSSVRCGDRQTCLTEPDTGAPRCVTCSYRCPRARSRPRPRGSGRAGAGAAGAAAAVGAGGGHRRAHGHADAAPFGPICGTNNHTYETWCHMLKDACATGFVIETQFAGHCKAASGAAVANTVLDSDTTANRYL